MKSDRIRLHKAVTNLVKYSDLEYTQAEVQRNIENYGVILSGQKTTKRLEWTMPYMSLDISHWPKREKGNIKDIKIISQDENYLAVFKPHNLVVSPGAGHKNDNLVSWLLKEIPGQRKMLDEAAPDSNAHISAGLVHRLDKDTQGILLIAKTQKDLEYFQSKFKFREVIKKYITILEGELKEEVSIKAYQARSKKNPLRQKLFTTELEASNYDKKAKNNESIFTPIAHCEETNTTLVEIEIKTGRMHQIRLQAEAIGYPIVNDPVYNSKPTRNTDTIRVPVEVVTKSKESFSKISTEIFNNQPYCLLSNSLELQHPNGSMLKLNHIELQDVINKYE